MEGLPPINIGALFMPPIWGAANGICLALVTIVFARAGQGYACQRALSMGKTKEQYLKSQKKWAVAMVIMAVVMIAAATYYNLVIRPTLGA